MNAERTWDQVWSDYYGRLTPEKAGDWGNEIREQLPGILGKEITAAIRWMPSQKAYKFPKLADLIDAIYQLRDHKRVAEGREKTQDEPFVDRARVVSVKEAMGLCNDHDERWEELCKGCRTEPECVQVDRWAEMQWADWPEARNKIRSAISRAIKRDMARIFAGCATETSRPEPEYWREAR